MTGIDSKLAACSLVQQPSARPLRVTCYGSSSSKTPARYLQEAFNLGYVLAKRGHTTVNGAGSFGCMKATTDGAIAGNGKCVGVIHEMWLVDQQDWESSSMTTNPLQVGKTLRDGGAHAIFTQEANDASKELLVAGGDDLQERKKLLVENADALVVLPGGPGTWDELWEMACARKLGMSNSLPICVVNIDGFYDAFYTIMERAYEDKLMDQTPEEIITFVTTAKEAVEWIEAIHENEKKRKPTLQKRSTALRKSSFLGEPVTEKKGLLGAISKSLSYLSSSFGGSTFSDDEDDLEKDCMKNMVVEEVIPASRIKGSEVAALASGIVMGAIVMNQYMSRTRR